MGFGDVNTTVLPEKVAHFIQQVKPLFGQLWCEIKRDSGVFHAVFPYWGVTEHTPGHWQSGSVVSVPALIVTWFEQIEQSRYTTEQFS